MSKTETAEFIRSHVIELGKLAQSADLSLLATLLNMAAIESQSIVREKLEQDALEAAGY